MDAVPSERDGEEAKCECESVASLRRDIIEKKPTSHSKSVGAISTLRTVVPEGVNSMGGVPEWEEIEMAVDSGACDNVMDPEELPHYDVKETRASINGVQFASATWEPIPDLGEMETPF